LDVHPAALGTWVPAFVRANNALAGITRPPTRQEIAAHRGLFAADALRVENLEMFVHHVAGARIRAAGEDDIGICDDGHVFKLDPRADLATIVAAARILAAPPERLHRLYTLLHPFTAGNGRCGRALFMWQVIRGAKAGPAELPRSVQRGAGPRVVSRASQRTGPMH
jgi:hypothetical protein